MAVPRTRCSLAAPPLLFALLLAALAPADARGEPTRRASPAQTAKAAKALREKLAALQARIERGEAEEALAALVEARALGADAAPLAPAVEVLLKEGTNVPVALASIDALGAMRARSSSAVIGNHLRHRSPELRRAAARALVETGGPEAATALREGLRSSDEQVRVASAEGLGRLGGATAMDDLYKALDRGLLTAASAIGDLCRDEGCSGLASRAGTLETAALVAGFDKIFFRPSPLPEELLVNLVERLRAHGRQEVDAYLERVASRWPATASQRVARALAGAAAEGGGT
ncbi:HEAT repeat domain-containing protein [Polyangium aurulentum]|uniref:HEAT repeat domain-containing protein n=1 Tax=Polyangium aurulentum TaxID=2567896 RepID=UPI0010ADAC85|nr:HEAT repeat domain-containing protein [Polyangium aurulentum]UQA61040.1 HEAT repeat domain-containing protein [Polyangium aurulentum]